MENYDLKMHLPQQIEYYLGCFASGDPAGLKRTLDNIKDLIKDETLGKPLSDYEEERISKLEEKQKAVLKHVQELIKSENVWEIFQAVEQSKNELVEDMESVEGDYWGTIRTYLIDMMNRT